MPRKTPAPVSLEIHLFGPFRIAIDGVAIDDRRWKRRKPKQLVKLLALQPHHQLHREQAMEMLWPELDVGAAANNLHKTIHVARHALELSLMSGSDSRFIFTQDHQIILRAPRALWIDTEAFEERAAAALKSHNPEFFEAALELYPDDLLVEDPYEDWAATRREQLRASFHNLLAKLAEVYETERRFAQSIECLKRLVTRNLSDEESHRQLMRLYTLTGSRHLALLQYRLCCESIRRELGTEPEAETFELHRQITSGEIQSMIQRERRVSAAPLYHQLTFRRGPISTARFAPDASTVLYSAAWNDEPIDVYTTRVERPESHSLGLAGAELLAVSHAGELAVMRKQLSSCGHFGISIATRISLAVTGNRISDESPQVLAERVKRADWSQPSENVTSDDAKSRLAVVRDVGRRDCLEFPVGTPLYETSGRIDYPRVSPNGDFVAFINNPVSNNERSSVAVVDSCTGQKRTLSAGWSRVQGLAWSAAGDEIWFTANDAGQRRALHAVTLAGKQRMVERIAGSLTLHDISPEGQTLITLDNARVEMAGLFTETKKECNLSWLDWSLACDVTPDGNMILFTEAGEGGGNHDGVYIRGTATNAQARRIGGGFPLALSPDGKWALTKSAGAGSQLVLLSTDENVTPRVLQSSSVIYQAWACWFPDGERIIFVGNEPHCGSQLFVQRIARGKPLCITPDIEGVQLASPHSISPDGARVVAIAPDETVWLYSVTGGAARKIEGLTKGDVPIRWSDDGESLYFFRRDELPASVYQLSLVNKRRTLWKKLMPSDPAGVTEILRVLLTPDLKFCAYSYTRNLSDLFVVYGLK